VLGDDNSDISKKEKKSNEKINKNKINTVQINTSCKLLHKQSKNQNQNKTRRFGEGNIVPSDHTYLYFNFGQETSCQNSKV